MSGEATKTCPHCGKPVSDKLLGLCPDCMLKAGLESGSVSPDAKLSPPSVEELARRFPQLEILELLGRGGMGAVYKARQKQLDRIVALKILPPQVADAPGFADRFAREAKALAALSHPNIVTLYEFGEAAAPTSPPASLSADAGVAAATPHLFYFLMEFVDGLNLRQLLGAGKLAPKEALAIVPQICDALQYAHDRGIVHRDIKPENILLGRDGVVKIADFGVAKIVGRSDGAAKRRSDEGEATQPGAVGTPAYMSPEQVDRPAEVDHRADIYSLGVVLYQMLTGELPGKNIEAPSRKVQIDVRIDEIVLRALERNPEMRYSQASVLKTQIETVVASSEFSTPATSTTPAPPLQSRTMPGRPRRRHLWVAGLLFAATCALANAIVNFSRYGNWGSHDYAIMGTLWLTGMVGFLIAAWRHYRRTTPAPSPAAGISVGSRTGVPPASDNLGNVPSGFFRTAIVGACVNRAKRVIDHRFGLTRRAVLVLGGGILLCIAASIWRMTYSAPPRGLPKAGFVERRLSSRSPFPKSAHIGRNNLSEFIVHDDVDLHFAIFYDGNFSTSAGGSHNADSRIWIDRGSLKLGNGRTFGYSREADWPFGLTVNGQEFDLRQGRVLVLHDDGTVRQIRLFPPLSTASDPATLAKLITSTQTLYQEPADLPQLQGQLEIAQSQLRDLLKTHAPTHKLVMEVQHSVRVLEQKIKQTRASASASPSQPAPSPTFGPASSCVIHDLDEGAGDEALNLGAGKLLNLTRDIGRLPATKRNQWLNDNGIDLLADYARNRWALMVNGLKLATTANDAWEKATPDSLQTALDGRETTLEIIERPGEKFFLLPQTAVPPITFAFETRSGQQGILQITAFTDTPHGLAIRYKLLQQPATKPSALPEAGPASATGLSIECRPSSEQYRVGGKVLIWCTLTNTTQQTRPVAYNTTGGSHFLLSSGTELFEKVANGMQVLRGGLLPRAIPHIREPLTVRSGHPETEQILDLPPGKSIQFLLDCGTADKAQSFTGRIVYDPAASRDAYVVPSGRPATTPWQDELAVSDVFTYQVLEPKEKP